MKDPPREWELSRFRPITKLALPSRATNALFRSGVRSVGQLVARSREELMTEVLGLGEVMLRVIEAAVAEESLSLPPADIPSAAFAQISVCRARRVSKTGRHVNKHKASITPTDEKP